MLKLRKVIEEADLVFGAVRGCSLRQVLNAAGSKRVVVTKDLPGDRWHQVLTGADCRVEVCAKSEEILSVDTIKALIGKKCDGVIGQLTEVCHGLFEVVADECSTL